MMNIEYYSIETISPQTRPAIWVGSGNGIYPVCYFRKPKWMTERQFERVVNAIRLEARPDILEDTEDDNE